MYDQTSGLYRFWIRAWSIGARIASYRGRVFGGSAADELPRAAARRGGTGPGRG